MISSVTQKDKKKQIRGWTLEDEQEENELSSYFFGTTEENNDDSNENKIVPWSYGKETNEEEVGFVIDRKGTENQLTSYEDNENENEEEKDHQITKPENNQIKAVWQDEDDEEVNMLQQTKRKKLRHALNETSISIKEYEHRLRTRYNETASSQINTDWAKQSDDLILGTESLYKKEIVPLPPNQIKMIRHADLNRETFSNDNKKSTIQVVKFYKEEKENPLVITAGFDCMLNFYRISKPSNNEEKVESNKIKGFYFKNFPIRNASFLNNQTPKVVLSSRRNYLYLYDAISGVVDTIPKIPTRAEKSYENMITSPNGYYIAIIGNDGYVLLLSSQTKRLIQTLKINGSVRSISFHPDDSHMLFVGGSDGIVYRFDLRSSVKCLDKIYNEDGTTIHSLECFRDTFQNEYRLAVGSESGVVNLYNLSPKPTLSKTIMNLKTSITNIKPNSSSILGLGSSFSRDGLRLMHMQSGTIFANWPTRNTPLGYVFDFDFSPDDRYMCIGNDKGKCLLYEFLHFS